MFDVVLIYLPGWVNQNALMYAIKLPFVPAAEMAIELKESFGGHPSALPYIDDVTWNVERARFECRVLIHDGHERTKDNEGDVMQSLRDRGWVDLA